jgi:hypothetical protein
MSNNYEKATKHYELIDTYTETIYSKINSNMKYRRTLMRKSDLDKITNFSANKSILKKEKDNNNILNSIDSKQEKDTKRKIEYKDYNIETRELEVTFEDFKNLLSYLKDQEIIRFLENNNDNKLKSCIGLFMEFNYDNTVIKIRDKKSINFLLSFMMMSVS